MPFCRGWTKKETPSLGIHIRRRHTNKSGAIAAKVTLKNLGCLEPTLNFGPEKNILIVIKTTPGNIELRKVIRTTWLPKLKAIANDNKISSSHFFVVGRDSKNDSKLMAG